MSNLEVSNLIFNTKNKCNSASNIMLLCIKNLFDLSNRGIYEKCILGVLGQKSPKMAIVLRTTLRLITHKLLDLNFSKNKSDLTGLYRKMNNFDLKFLKNLKKIRVF